MLLQVAEQLEGAPPEKLAEQPDYLRRRLTMLLEEREERGGKKVLRTREWIRKLAEHLEKRASR